MEPRVVITLMRLGISLISLVGVGFVMLLVERLLSCINVRKHLQEAVGIKERK